MIGTLHETDLHAALKRYYARPNDRLEANVAGFVVDVLRANAGSDRQDIVEIQTHNFAALKHKLPRLLEQHAVTLVYPIAAERWVVRVQADQRTVIGRRKSPHRGQLSELFLELVSIPQLVAHPNFTLEVALIHEEEWRCPATGKRRSRWLRPWRTFNRQLLKVVDRVALSTPRDFTRFIPPDLSTPFTSRELASVINQPDALAHKITYCLRKMGTLDVVGKRGNAWLYALTPQNLGR